MAAFYTRGGLTLTKNAANWRRGKGVLYRVPLGAGGNAAGRGGQSQHRPSAGRHGRPAQKGTGAIANGDADKLLWDKMSQSRVWGGSPTSVFAARRDAKIASVATLALLAVSAVPGKPRKTEAAPFLTLPPFLWLFVFPLRWLP